MFLRIPGPLFASLASLVILGAPEVWAQSSPGSAPESAPPSATPDWAGIATPDRNEALAAIIADYEDLQARFNPDAAARTLGISPSRWPTVTPQAVAAAADARSALLDRLMLLDGLEGSEAIDRDVLIALLQEDLVNAKHDLDRIPFTGDWGFHIVPVFAASQLHPTSVAGYEAWIDRLNDVPRYFGENIANMRRGIETGFTSYPDPLRTVIDQIAEQVAASPEESPLYAPFLDFPDTISPGDRVRLAADGRAAVATALGAYKDLEDFLEYDYAPMARERPGLGTLPGGKEAYADLLAVHLTRSDLTPDEVHEIGVREVARIRAEMEAILTEIGYEGSFQDFLTFLRTDPQFYARTPDQLLNRAEQISARLRAILPLYFETLPSTDFNVEPVPAAIAPGFTTARYVQGDPSIGRAGTYLVNTYRLDQRPYYELPALSAHEAVPGHHLQITRAQEMTGVADFRRDYYATAFGEGWALYAEQLAGEAGIYRTPYERFGALSYQMWRACRLVADTGMHWLDWSREEAEACFVENSALAPLNIQTEVTRYIGWPGQADAYMIGQLTILDLRRKAEEALGDAFDIKAFHEVVIGEGSMPLERLEARVERWIDEQVAAP